MSKWGLRGLTKSASVVLSDTIVRVNAVHSGLVMIETGVKSNPQPEKAQRKCLQIRTPEILADPTHRQVAHGQVARSAKSR
jgi:NAD(P)-dependent dehydrogenase (short-subunit alcohol dehydrogenase family)